MEERNWFNWIICFQAVLEMKSIARLSLKIFQKLQCSDIDLIIPFACSIEVSLFIASIALASLKCLFKTLAKMILNTQSVNITLERVGSLFEASFDAVGL